MIDDEDRAWLARDFRETKRLILLAKSYSDSMDEVRKIAEAKIYITKSCENCAYYFRRDGVCVSYGPPLGLGWIVKKGGVLAIGDKLAPKLYCKHWDDLDLKKLLLSDLHPSYYRRHPITFAPFRGRMLFALILVIRTLFGGLISSGAPTRRSADDTVKAILAYLNDRSQGGVQMITYERLRRVVDSSLTDQELDHLVLENPSIFRAVRRDGLQYLALAKRAP